MADNDFNISSLPVNSGKPESSSDSLSQQIKQTQTQIDALGQFISEAMSQMYQAALQLERLQEAAKLGPFYGFIENELGMEL